MQTLEMLEVFGVQWFMELATPEQMAELNEAFRETQAEVARALQQAEIDTCELLDTAV